MFTAGKQVFLDVKYILNRSRGFAQLYFQRLSLKQNGHHRNEKS